MSDRPHRRCRPQRRHQRDYSVPWSQPPQRGSHPSDCLVTSGVAMVSAMWKRWIRWCVERVDRATLRCGATSDDRSISSPARECATSHGTWICVPPHGTATNTANTHTHPTFTFPITYILAGLLTVTAGWRRGCGWGVGLSLICAWSMVDVWPLNG